MNATLGRSLDAKRSELLDLCREHGVSLLELVGSGTDSDWDPMRSDLDFVVRFRDDPTRSLAHRFLGLAQDLETLLGVPVDLLTKDSIRNPYFRAAIEAGRVTVYAE